VDLARRRPKPSLYSQKPYFKQFAILSVDSLHLNFESWRVNGDVRNLKLEAFYLSGKVARVNDGTLRFNGKS
jgi:hypothetical protein